MSEWKKWERNLNNVPGSIITVEKKQSDVKLKRKWNDFWFCHPFRDELCCTVFAISFWLNDNYRLVVQQSTCQASSARCLVWCSGPIRNCYLWVLQRDEWRCLIRGVHDVDVKSMNHSIVFFPPRRSSYVFLRGLWVPRGCAGIHCQLGHHLHHVRGLHHLLFARLHQRGQEETGGEVSERENVTLKVFTPKSPYVSFKYFNASIIYNHLY